MTLGLRPPLTLPLLLLLFLLLAIVSVSSARLRSRQRRSAQLPDPYAILCNFRECPECPQREQKWCRKWLQCIEKKSQPSGANLVMKAWSPADCEEYCGIHPVTSPYEGGALLQERRTALVRVLADASGKAASGHRGTAGDCLASCKNFQKSLANCVGQLLFNPGQIGENPEDAPPAPEYCTADVRTGRETPCMPDLPLRAQQCSGKETKAILRGEKFEDEECLEVKDKLDFCKDCPALKGDSHTKYLAFTGGCKNQLNAYWQATHPDAGVAAVPGASGCTVH